MKNELIPMIFKKPNTMFVETNRMIEWVSREKDETGQPLCIRIPEPKERKFPIIGFVAGGMLYPTTLSLMVRQKDKSKGLYSDIYRRTVLIVNESFPCFDSEDYQHENRYYHWAYLIGQGHLICVYWEDEGTWIEVTEDVRVVKEWAWKAMEQAGLIQDGILVL